MIENRRGLYLLYLRGVAGSLLLGVLLRNTRSRAGQSVIRPAAGEVGDHVLKSWAGLLEARWVGDRIEMI